MNFKKKLVSSVFTLPILFSSYSLQAYLTDTGDAAFNFWAEQDWQLIGTDDGIRDGRGGQGFDTEYLFFKYDHKNNSDFSDDTISIGLQTGFDVTDNHYLYNNLNYYGGDLALSFDGNVNNGSNSTNPLYNGYEFAVDFGLLTRDQYGRNHNDGSLGNVNIGADENQGTGIDGAGLYSVTEWNNRITSVNASPFAMDEGTILQGLTFSEFNGDNSSNVAANGFGMIGDSYYRTVTFNANQVLATSASFTVDAHWTMSCGNDQINGGTLHIDNTPNDPKPVSEPSVLALFSLGLLGMGFISQRRRKL